MLSVIPDRHTASEKIADIDFKFYRDGITFDLESNNAIVSHIVEVKDELKHCYEYGLEKLADITNNLFTPARPPAQSFRRIEKLITQNQLPWISNPIAMTPILKKSLTRPSNTLPRATSFKSCLPELLKNRIKANPLISTAL